MVVLGWWWWWCAATSADDDDGDDDVVSENISANNKTVSAAVWFRLLSGGPQRLPAGEHVKCTSS